MHIRGEIPAGVEKMTNLLVIGNGFDKAHNIPSGYQDFKSWLEENDSSLLDKMCEFFSDAIDVDSDWWTDFENNLDRVKAHKKISEVVRKNYPDFGSDDFRDREYHAAEFEMEREMNELYGNIQKDFVKWVHSLECKCKEKFLFQGYNMFLTFNYTDTLIETYDINPSRILFIHGRAKNGDNLILGHNCNPNHYEPGIEYEPPEPPDSVDTPEEMDDWYQSHTDDYFTSSARSAVKVAVESFRKPTEEIIDKYRVFFGMCSNLDEVSFYGFGFSPVDMPYIKTLADNMKAGAKWKIYCFDERAIKIANNVKEEFQTEQLSIEILNSKDFGLFPQIPGLYD